MNSKADEMTPAEKTARIEVLIEHLYAVEHQTFLEVQLGSKERVYQSYPNNHNVTGLSGTQPDDMLDVIDDYGLHLEVEESHYVTALHTGEQTVEMHMEILTDILSEVYDLSFGDVELAFLAKREEGSPEPLLWTDIEVEGW